MECKKFGQFLWAAMVALLLLATAAHACYDDYFFCQGVLDTVADETNISLSTSSSPIGCMTFVARFVAFVANGVIIYCCCSCY
ncbi:hypothetical protein EPI10_022002 [Gossypium australe]|uniref:Uncharacterized protein n=1 Tax=Gossypium australe TaxID=47621 RepID=A0A5B6WIZ8_9ROSI|nr:hypothetical protein EPI10_022002 [Gossypium australe]